MEVPGSMTSDPLVEAIVRLLTRHHNGCDHPVQPAPWMRNAATEIADAINLYGEFRRRTQNVPTRNPESE